MLHMSEKLPTLDFENDFKILIWHKETDFKECYMKKLWLFNTRNVKAFVDGEYSQNLANKRKTIFLSWQIFKSMKMLFCSVRKLNNTIAQSTRSYMVCLSILWFFLHRVMLSEYSKASYKCIFIILSKRLLGSIDLMLSFNTFYIPTIICTQVYMRNYICWDYNHLINSKECYL